MANTQERKQEVAYGLHPSACAYGVQPAGRLLQDQGAAGGGEVYGPDRLCHHGPRCYVRRHRLLSGLQGGGREANHRLRGLCGPSGPYPVRQGPRVRQREPPSGAAVRKRGGLSQPLLHGVSCLDGGLLCETPYRSGPFAGALQGPDRTFGVSGRGDPPPPAERGV